VGITAYLTRRLFHSVLVLIGVLTVVFLVGHGIGDPARLMLSPEASQEQYQALRKSLGLDDPLYIQFIDVASKWVVGNFGKSLWQRAPALQLVLQRTPATLYLATVTMCLAIPIGILLGMISAIRPRSLADHIVTVLSLGSVSIAGFWLGLMLILIFAVQLHWFKTSGFGGWQYVTLPALTLAFSPMGRIAQVARTALQDALSEPYMSTARAKGLSERACIFNHALKNAAIPIVTLSGSQVAALVSGAVVTETVFGWPGIGILLIQAIQRRDLPLVEATVFVTATLVIVLNLLVDLTYVYLDPRVRYS
jgi:peptide/nickel transport system permease protein